jgi:hypothetical protein
MYKEVLDSFVHGVVLCKTNTIPIWCTRCAFRLMKSLQWCSNRKSWKFEKKCENCKRARCGKILLTDRRATIRSVLKVVYFLRTFWDIFLHSHTQPDPKQGIKIFLWHLLTTFAPSLTLQVSLPFATWPNIDISNMANDKRKFKCGTFNAALDIVRYLQG